MRQVRITRVIAKHSTGQFRVSYFNGMSKGYTKDNLPQAALHFIESSEAHDLYEDCTMYIPKE